MIDSRLIRIRPRSTAYSFQFATMNYRLRDRWLLGAPSLDEDRYRGEDNAEDTTQNQRMRQRTVIQQ